MEAPERMETVIDEDTILRDFERWFSPCVTRLDRSGYREVLDTLIENLRDRLNALNDEEVAR